MPFDNPQVEERYEKKRDEDMADINRRIEQIEVERSYRIAGMLEQTAKDIKTQIVGKLTEMRKEWKRKVYLFDGITFAVLAVLFGLGLTFTDNWSLIETFVAGVKASETMSLTVLGLLLGGLGYAHFSYRRIFADKQLKKFADEIGGSESDEYKQYAQAFYKSTSAFRPMFLEGPAGWDEENQDILDEIVNEANDYIQALNDQFTNPSGHTDSSSKS